VNRPHLLEQIQDGFFVSRKPLQRIGVGSEVQIQTGFDIALRMLIENPSDCLEHMMHGFTHVLTTMSSDEDKLAVLYPRHPLPIRITNPPTQSTYGS